MHVVILLLAAVLAAVLWRDYRRMRQVTAAAAAGRQQAAEIERFRGITQGLLGGQELGGVLETVAQAAADLAGAVSGHVSLREPGRTELVLAAATGPVRELVGEGFPLGGSMAGWVVTHGRPLLINDLAADPRAYAAANQRLGLARGVSVPLISRGEVVGALGAERGPGTPPFGPREITLLERLGEQAVLAVENAQVLDATRRARAGLAAKNAELEQAIRTKGDFLRNMSHELRTPLNSIIGFSELLTCGAAGPLGDAQREYLDTVVRNGRHLLQLINDLLDLSKVEAGRMDLHLTDTDVLALIDGVLEDSRGLLSGRDLRLAHDVMPGPIAAVADEVRIRQVLFNFVSNAVKFTPDGGEITVRAVRTAAPLPVPAQRADDTSSLKRRPAVWISVSDTGPGIAPEDLRRLFQEFAQVDTSVGRRSGGTGLGLVLCKRFIELHGGTIGAESVPGHGSTFWFLLPTEGPLRVLDAYQRAATEPPVP